jgi:hypothetical protein
LVSCPALITKNPVIFHVGIEQHLAKNTAATDYVVVIIIFVVVVVVVVVVVRGGGVGVVCGVPKVKPNKICTYSSHNSHYSCHSKHGTY